MSDWSINDLDAAVPYAKVLRDFGQCLLSIGRDKELEAELQRIVTKKNALQFIVGSLNKRYPPINDSP